MSPTNKMSVLHLPEVLHLIGSFLSKQDQARCARVTKAWNPAFSALLCQNLDLKHLLAHEGYKDFLARNAQWIELLQMEILSSSSYLPCFATTTGLRSLRLIQVQVAQDTVAFQNARWDELAGLVKQNPRLRDVCISIPYGRLRLRPTLQFWKALQGAKELRSLRLLGLDVKGGEQGSDAEVMDTVLDVFMLLDTLVLDKLVLADPTEKWRQQLESESRFFKSLKYATLMGHGPAWSLLLKWSLDSFQLERFSWKGEGTETSWVQGEMDPILVECFAKSTGLSHLRYLTLYDRDIFSDMELQTVLGSCSRQPLQELILEDSEFGELAFKALCQPLSKDPDQHEHLGTEHSSLLSPSSPIPRSHLLTLRHLDLTGCFTVTSAMTQHILTSCHMLEHLAVPALHVQEVVAGQGTRGEPVWVCRRLKDLRVFINGFEDEDEELDLDDNYFHTKRHLAVFKELSQLQELRIVDIGRSQLHSYFSQSDSYDKGLDFTEGFGRELLVGKWNELESLNLKYTEQDFKVEDVEWMAIEFPKLTDFEWKAIIFGESLVSWSEEFDRIVQARS